MHLPEFPDGTEFTKEVAGEKANTYMRRLIDDGEIRNDDDYFTAFYKVREHYLGYVDVQETGENDNQHVEDCIGTAMDDSLTYLNSMHY